MSGVHKYPTISFRISPRERDEIEAKIKASGMQKKDYFVRSCIYNKVCVVGKREVAAVDYLKEKGVLNYEKLQYRGIDPLGNVWRRIWNDIKEYFGNGINFYQKDILELVDIITRHSWISDVLIFQYVFSDMYKNSSTIEINQFIDKLATFLNACGEKPIYILCNDINLSKSYNGGREFFDVLESKISNPKIVRRMHFNNNNKDRHFEYGDEYKRNCLIFDDIPDEIRKAYNPFDSCASAQILIKKEQKEVIR